MSERLARLAARPSPRLAAVAATLVLLAVGAWEAWVVWSTALASPNHAIGRDLQFYVDATTAWLDGQGFYRPDQVTGLPYQIQDGHVLYPPPTVLLFLPWALGMPWLLWWLIPVGSIAASIVTVRPSPYAWPLLALALVDPRTWAVVVYGNPSLWAIAAIAAGSAWGWPAVGTLVKPAFWPFAAIGFRRPRERRRTAVALLAMLLIGLAFLPMWHDYWLVITDAQTPRGVEYTLGEVPIGLLMAAGLWSRTELRGKAGRQCLR